MDRVISREALAGAAVAVVCTFALVACGGGSGTSVSMSPTTVESDPPATTSFTDTTLVSNRMGVVATATTIDANLSNPWGIAVGPGLPFWIADNNSNLSTLYSGAGEVETQQITGSTDVGIAIPPSAAGVQSNPTGQVYNASGGFLISTPNGQETALFIFDGEGGTIAGWAKDSGAAAVTAYDDGVANGTNHAVYKGLAIGTVMARPTSMQRTCTTTRLTFSTPLSPNRPPCRGNSSTRTCPQVSYHSASPQ